MNTPTPTQKEQTDLDALSEAGVQYTDHLVPGHARHPGYGVAAAIACGLIVTLVLFLIAPRKYECKAALTIQASPEAHSSLKAEMVNFTGIDHTEDLWHFVRAKVREQQEQENQGNNKENPDGLLKSLQWQVTSQSENVIELSIIADDPQVGIEQASDLLGAYFEHAHAREAMRRNTPTETETVIGKILSRLQLQMDDARQEFALTGQEIALQDPRHDQTDLLKRWDILREEVWQLGEEFERAAEHHQNLENAPPPSRGVVEASKREEALRSDPALQQDLQELRVNLMELKLQMLAVRQKTTPFLQELQEAADALYSFAKSQESGSNSNDGMISITSNNYNTPSDGSTSDHSNGSARVASTASQYLDLLASLTKTWNTEFSTINDSTIDPLHPELPDAYTRIRKQLNDFLFLGGRQLTQLRETLRHLQENPQSLARYNVLQSNFGRRFETLQDRHHQFEFAAVQIEPRSSVRLDAALSGSRGLRRRTRQRIDQIEHRLETEALKEAHDSWQREIEQVKEARTRIRTKLDASVASLLALQQKLNLTSNSTQRFLQQTFQKNLAASRLELVRAQLDSTEQYLDDLSKRRRQNHGEPPLELMPHRNSVRAIHDWQRMQSASIAGGLTIIILVLSQLRLIRR